MDAVTGIIIIGVAVAVYFLPGILAVATNHPSQNLIMFINAAFGWTLLVWVGTLIWAFLRPQPVPVLVVNSPPPQPPPADTMACPACAETIKSAAKICRYCGYQLGPVIEARRV